MHFFAKAEFFRAKTTVYGTKTTVYGRWVEKRFPLFYNHCTEGYFDDFYANPSNIKRR